MSSSMLTTALFAASAAAQITTTFWMPYPYVDSNEAGYVGSVIGVDGDKTSLKIHFDDDTDTNALYYSDITQTITLQGSTYYEEVMTTTDDVYGYDYTFSIACSEKASETRAAPVCTESSQGAYLYSYYCSGYTGTYTDPYTTTDLITYTSDEFGPATTETFVETYDPATYIPDYCTESGVSTIPNSLATNSETLSGSYYQTYQLVITAGTDKLSATTGATTSVAKSTGTKSSGTGSQTGTETGASSKSTASSVPDGTGAAVPMITRAPVLAGLGLAAAALVL